MARDEAAEPSDPTQASTRRNARPWVPRVAMRGRFRGVQESVRALVRRILPDESQHLFALTLVVGVVCGFVAVAFHLSIRAAERLLIDRALAAPGSLPMLLWIVIAPTLGGLVAGAALTWVVPGARGSGIPQVKQAFATEGGRIRVRDAIGKFVLASLQIGSGASLGREGPTVHICAGATSLLARATSLPPRQMRRLTPVGVAAGIAAAFNAPIAAVTFTIEEIVGTLDQSVLSGVVVAAALAAVIERRILGVHPVIAIGRTYSLDHPSSLALYALLGIVAAFVSIAFTDGLLGVRLGFRRLRVVPSFLHPAIGGMVTGVLAAVALRFLGTSGVTGGGYETLGRALEGALALRVLVALCGLKLLATVFSYSSGGAGGIFAPSLFVGAMLGGAVGYLDVSLLHHEARQLGAFALVGMGAVFAGVIRAPITSVLIIFEMTGDYGLVLPLMLTNATAYVLARRFRPMPIYEALLAQDGVTLPHATASSHPLELLRVADAMTRDVFALGPSESVGEARSRLASQSFSCVPVIDAARHVLGIVSVEALLGATDAKAPVTTLLGPRHTIRSDAPLLRAVVRMNDLGVRQLMVVDDERETELVGIVAMSDLVRAHARVATGSTESAPPSRPDALAELHPNDLAVPAKVVSGSTPLLELAEMRDAGASAFLVRDEGRTLGVLFPEHLDELARDEGLGRMVIAADLARTAAEVAERDGLSTWLAGMREEHVEAVVVVGASGVPRGIVTKEAFARAFLDWHARRAASHDPAVPVQGGSTSNPS